VVTDPYTKEAWRALLELQLRRSAGIQFQDYFSQIMSRAHGESFVRTRPHGQLGDRGCDGYLQQSGLVYACYGTVNGRTPAMSDLLSKIENDAQKSSKFLSVIQKGWCFTHNFVDGVPTDVILALKKVESDIVKVPVAMFGPESFANLVLSLPEDQIIALLGPAITESDIANLNYAEVRQVVSELATQAMNPLPDANQIRPVSSEKLSYNSLSGTWQTLLIGGIRNAASIEQYFASNASPMLESRVADTVRGKFISLQLQALSPDEILNEVYAMLLGSVNARPERQVAALALMGHFFETCTLLNDVPATQST
jgi:hypothetical protein